MSSAALGNFTESSFSPKSANDSPSPWGEGRGEGERFHEAELFRASRSLDESPLPADYFDCKLMFVKPSW